MTQLHLNSPVPTVVKPVAALPIRIVKKHCTFFRISLFVGLVVILVVVNEHHITFYAVAVKLGELFTDVVTDRVFPDQFLRSGGE